jgi:transposase
MSQREAARHFSISRDSVAKMMAFSIPPGYRRTAPVKRPKLDAFTGIIDGWLEGDRAVHRKQRHTAKRVFERRREEHGFTGGYTIVKDYMRQRERRGREMFVPLVHPPGQAQADFGEAVVAIGGVEQKAHFFVLVAIGSAIGPSDNGDAAQRCLLCPGLPSGDRGSLGPLSADCCAIACRAVDGHVQAFAFFGKVPVSVVYDNDRCPPLGHASMPCRSMGGEDPAGWDAPAGHALQRVPVALPVPRPLRPPRQGERVSH